MHESVVLKTCMDALVRTLPHSVMLFLVEEIHTHGLVKTVSSGAGRHCSLEGIRDSLVSTGSAD